MLRLLVLLLALGPTAVMAQTLSERLQRAGDGAVIAVEKGEGLATTVIEGRRVTLAGGGARLSTEGNEAAFIVRAGGHLIVEDVHLGFAGGGGDQPLFFVADGGRVSLANCVLEAGTAVALFARAGQVEITDCILRAGAMGLGLSGGAEGNLRDVRIEGAASGLRVTGSGSLLTIGHTTISGGGRGLTVEDGAIARVDTLTVDAASEAALFVAAAGLSGQGVRVTDAAAFGLYATDGAEVDLTDASLDAVAGQALTFQGAGPSRLGAARVADAGIALVVDGGGGPVTLEGPDLSARDLEARMVELGAGALVLRGGSIEGGATGIGVGSGALVVEGTVLGGQARAGLYISDAGSGSVALMDMALAVGDGAYGVLTERAIEMRGARIVHRGVPLAGDGVALSVIEGNARLGGTEAGWPTGLEALNRSLPADGATLATILDAPDAAARRDGFRALGPLTGALGTPGTLNLLSRAIGAAQQPAALVPLGTLLRAEGDDMAEVAMLTPADLPMKLAPGAYVLRGPGGDQRFAMEAGGQVLLPFTPAPGPYPVYDRWEAAGENASRRAGRTRGPGLALRPGAEVAWLADHMWPGYAAWRRILVPRPGATASMQAAALAVARAEFAAILPQVAEDVPFDTLVEIAPTVSERTVSALDILQVLGRPEDAALLIAQGERLTRRGLWLGQDWVRRGLMIDQRLGLPEDGAARAAFARIADGREEDASVQAAIVLPLAEAGFAPARDWLMTRLVRWRGLAEWDRWQRADALRILSTEDDPALTAYAHDLLTAWRTGDLTGVVETLPADLNWAVAHAHLIVAARGDATQRAALSVPLSQWNAGLPMAAGLADPFDYLRGHHGHWSGQAPDIRIDDTARTICHAAGPRAPLVTREAALAGLLQHSVARFDDISPRWGETVSEIALAHCRVHAPSLSLLRTLDSDLMREAGPPFWQHAYADWTRPEGVSSAALDHAPDRWRAGVLAAEPQSAAEYRPYVATTRHDAAAGRFFPDGDRRFFLEPVMEEPAGEAFWLAGRLDMRIVPHDGALWAALRLDVTGTSHQGLAGMIGGHPDILDAALADGGQGLIRAVTLSAGGETPVALAPGPSGGGVLLFGPVAAPRTAADLFLDIEMGAGGGMAGERLRGWTVRFPLYHGPDAFRRLLTTDSLGLERMLEQ